MSVTFAETDLTNQDAQSQADDCIELDHEFRIHDIGSKIETQLGYTSRDVFQKNINDICVPERNKNDFLILRQITEAGFFHDLEKEFLDKGGKKMRFLVSGIRYTDTQGSYKYKFYLRDISQYHVIRQKYEEKLSDFSTFIYRTSHDIKGPLARIRGLINLIQIESKQDTVKNYAQLISDTTDTLNATLDKLMVISDVMVGDKLQPQPIEFENVIHEVLRKVSTHENILEVFFDIKANHTRRILNHENLLNVALFNIIHNALRFKMPLRKSLITIIVEDDVHQNGAVTLRVADNGLGIKRDVLDKIFDMFYKASGSTEGNGLGLYLTRLCVEKMNGIVSCQSVEEIGTEFKIIVPSL